MTTIITIHKLPDTPFQRMLDGLYVETEAARYVRIFCENLREMEAECEHEYDMPMRTGYVGVYTERCIECGHINEFEKDFT